MESHHPSPATPSAPRLRGLLVALCTALALVVAGNSALAIALPAIAEDLGADQAELTWIVDAYALTFAALLLTAGLTADKVGRRTVIVIGLSIFGGASLLSAFSASPEWLIALRAVAGAGAAAIFPVTLSALVDAYPPERRTFAVAVWSGVSSAGAVLGTIVAGLMLEVFGWGSVQVLFGGISLALVVACAVLVAQGRNPELSADPVAALWSILGLGGIVYAVIEGAERGWTDPLVAVAVVAGATGLTGFVVHQLRSRHPSLDVRLFGTRGLAAGSIIVTAQFFASLGLFVLAPQYLQLVDGFTALGAAVTLLIIPVGVGAGIGGSVALARRFGNGVPGAAGLLTMAAAFAGTAWLLTTGTDPSLWALGAFLLVFGVGFGLGITPGTELIIDALPAERRSIASAVNDITREVGGVLGIAVLSSALLVTYRREVRPVAETVGAALQELIESGAGAAFGAAEQLGADGAAIVVAAQDAFASGIGTASWVAAGVLVAAGLACAVIAPGRARTDAAAAPAADVATQSRSGRLR